jgi:hypothetical protein
MDSFKIGDIVQAKSEESWLRVIGIDEHFVWAESVWDEEKYLELFKPSELGLVEEEII